MCGRAGVLVVLVGVVCALPRILPPTPTPPSAHSGKGNVDEEINFSGLQHVFGRDVDSLAPPEGHAGAAVDAADSGAALRSDLQDPEVTPGFFQGDMVGLTPENLEMNTRVALKWEVFPERKWTNATVPYHISSLYGTSERVMIETAISTLRFLTCIKFVNWDRVTPDYLFIYPVKHPKGCWSYVGRRGGQQLLSLQQPSSHSKGCFGSLGKPIHELLHALGIFHEQARPDRDEHVTIITENIVPYYIHNFNKLSADNTTFPYPYDYSSVMHYGSDFFSYYRGLPTIVPKKAGATIGQRVMLSKLDCIKLNDVYGCLDDPDDRLKYTTFCNFMGIECLS